jgi:DNA-binding response OmpR family regulator
LANILVADKDETMRGLMDVSLTRIGHTIRLSDSGEKTLELIREEKFDLAIIDYTMSDMGAMDILQSLTENDDEIPQMMILSAKSTADTIRECIEAGAKDYVVKPFNLPVLIERIEILLKKADS